MTQGYDPRYPIGRFEAQPSSTPADRLSSIQVIRELPAQLRDAVSGLSSTQLETPYREGGWTVRQLIHHVADSHANAYVRFKLALTEDTPTIKPYNEAAWAQLADSLLPIEISLTLIDVLHLRWVALLESLSDADFDRAYNHPENGKQNLATVVALYAWHSRHHTAHVTRLRERMGW